MARLHVLQQTGNNIFDVVCHAPTPAGNNVAGITWVAALGASGLNTTRLSVGNGPGQITQAEANNIANGTVIEAPFVWEDNPSWTNPQRLADLETRAQQAVAEAVAQAQRALKYYGYTVV